MLFVFFIWAILGILFPSNQVKHIAEQKLGELLKKEITISTARINLFKGIELKNIQIFENDSLRNIYPELPEKIIRLQALHLQYRLWPLIHRRIEIHSIRIDSLDVKLAQLPDQSLNLTTAFPGESISADTISADSTFSFPLAVQLKSFELNGLSVQFLQLMDSNQVTIDFGHLNGRISNFSLPPARGHLDWRQLQADVQLNMHDAILNIMMENGITNSIWQLNTRVNLDFSLLSHNAQLFSSRGELVINQTSLEAQRTATSNTLLKPKFLPELIRLNFASRTDLLGNTIFIDSLNATIEDNLLFSMTGKVYADSGAPHLDLTIKKSRIDLAQIHQVARELTPPDIQKILEKLELNGFLSLAGTSLHGPVDSLRLKTKITLRNSSVDFDSGLAAIDSLNANLNLETDILSGQLDNIVFSGKMKAPRYATVQDSFSIEPHNIVLEMQARLNDNFFPKSALLHLTADKIWGAAVEYSAKLNTSGDWSQIQAVSRLVADSLDFAELAPGITGRGSFALDLEGSSLQDITLNLTGKTEAVKFQSEEKWLPLQPQEIGAHILFTTDTTLTNFDFNHLDVTLGRYLTVTARGKLRQFGAESFTFTIEDAILQHQPAFAQLPEMLTANLGPFLIDGKTGITGEFQGHLPAIGPPDISGQLRLAIHPTRIDYPEADLKFWGIRATAIMDLSPENVTGNLDLVCDSLLITSMRPEPFSPVSLSTRFSIPKFERVEITNITLQAPNIRTFAIGSGRIDNLNTTPLTQLNTQIVFNSSDPVELIDQIYFSGGLTANTRLYLNADLLALNGAISLDDMSINMADAVKLNAFNGHLPFTQKLDLAHLRFISETIPPLLGHRYSEIPFTQQRPFFKSQQPELATLTIDEISSPYFNMQEISFDIQAGGSRIDIPRFQGKAYDGNIHGYLGLDLTNGRFDDPEEMLDNMQVWLKTTISSINTAKLNPIISARAKKSQINANLSLTGSGLNPTGQLDVAGFFHITEIGPKVTDNLLRTLDPTGSDKGIQTVRRMLGWGFKPKLVSFEIKHEHFYPAIFMSKPFYIPINIANGKVELARIPVKIFMEQAMQPARP